MSNRTILSLFAASNHHHVGHIMRFMEEVLRSVGSRGHLNHILLLYDHNLTQWRELYPRMTLPVDTIEFVRQRPWDLVSVLRRIKPDLLVIHGAYFAKLWRVLAMMPDLAARTIWIAWGGDLAQLTASHPPVSLRDVLREFLDHNVSSMLLPRLGLIGVLVQGDGCSLLQQFPNCRNVTRLFYPAIDDGPEGPPPPHVLGSGIARVICGNSAYPSNNHEELIRFVQHLSHPGVEWIFPLSYGPESEASRITRAGKASLGQAFHSLDRLLPLDEYRRWQDGCDILIFNHTNRNQQGLGSVYHFLTRGKKIYLRSDNRLYSELRSWGCVVHDTLQIPHLSWEQFAAPLTDAQARGNWEGFRKTTSRSVALQQWSEICKTILYQS